MIARNALLTASGLLLCGQSPPAIGTDGHGPPPRVEAAYRFDCPGFRAGLGWRQERFDPETVPAMSHSLRVTLLEFSVSGRRIASADLNRIRAMFGRLARIESVIPVCESGGIDILLSAMPKREWIGYIERGNAEEARPRAQIHAIKVSRTGAVRIEEPAYRNE